MGNHFPPPRRRPKFTGLFHDDVVTDSYWIRESGTLALPPLGGIRQISVIGEMLPPAAVNRLAAELKKGFDLVLSVGTTSRFPYIAGPILEAARAGLPTVEINPGETAVSDLVMHRLQAGAAVTLRELERLV